MLSTHWNVNAASIRRKLYDPAEGFFLILRSAVRAAYRLLSRMPAGVHMRDGMIPGDLHVNAAARTRAGR